jgi:hypothetical protein
MNRDQWLARYAPQAMQGDIIFGTIFGDHTVNETRDLVKAKSDQLHQMQSQRTSLGKAPDSTWDAQFSQLKERFNRKNSDAWMPDMSTCEDDYQAILRALSPVPNFVSSGSAQDLANRLMNAGGKIGPLPQSAAKDWDLKAYEIADKPVQVIETAGRAVRDAAGTASKSILTSPLFWIGLAIVGGVAYIGVTKAAPLAMF